MSSQIPSTYQQCCLMQIRMTVPVDVINFYLASHIWVSANETILFDGEGGGLWLPLVSRKKKAAKDLKQSWLYQVLLVGILGRRQATLSVTVCSFCN